MQYILADVKYPSTESRLQFHQKVHAALNTLPGVESVSLASNLPLHGSYGWRYEIEGEPPQPAEKRKSVSGVVITPEYFRTCGVSILRGRSFTASDGLAGSEVTIVNERFAREHWPNGDAIGKRLRIFKDNGSEVSLSIVGIVPQIRQNDPTRIEGDALIYVPLRQQDLWRAIIIARTKVPPASVVSAFRKEVQKFDENQPVSNVQTLDEVLTQARWPYRVFGSLFVIFAIIALVLASVGIYGVMSYSVSQRTQEIGVRIALGASSGNVLRLVFATGLRQLVIGVSLGLAAAIGVTRVLKGILVQISPTDPVTFAAITLLLSGVAAFACWIPARRAVRTDPMVALRYQ
jgi:putative ABC transport system permease protein